MTSPKLPTTLSTRDRNLTRRMVTESYFETMRLIMLIAAALTWCGALAAAITVRPPSARDKPILAPITKPS
jgi:hypothetical protein